MDIDDKKKTGLYSILAYLGVFYILAIFLQLIVRSIYVSLGGNNSYEVAGIYQLLIYAILLGVLLFINKKDIKPDLVSYKEDCKKHNYSIVIPVIAGLGVLYVVNIFQNYFVSSINTYSDIISLLFKDSIFNINSTSDNQNYIVELITKGGLLGAVPMIIAAVFVGPICEEIVFRKSLFSFFKDDNYALMLSSFLFASIHIISSFGSYSIISIILMYVPYLCSGLVFGYIYKKNNRNVYVSTIVHMLSNLISIVGIIVTGLI